MDVAPTIKQKNGDPKSIKIYTKFESWGKTILVYTVR
jgi:hypothetical protein